MKTKVKNQAKTVKKEKETVKQPAPWLRFLSPLVCVLALVAIAAALLLLEDVGVASYQVDRALYQLWQSGLLRRVNGVLFGAFTGGDDQNDPGDPSTAEVIESYARLVGKPAITNVPAGHIWTNGYIPFGVHAVMKANADGTASLVFDEAAALPRESKK